MHETLASTIDTPDETITGAAETPRRTHTCPVWVGRLMASPVRRLVERPEQQLAPWVRPGDCVVDVGCAMGFYSLALARLVGREGRIVALDVQEPMLSGLGRRAARHGLDLIVEPRLCGPDRLGIDDLAGSASLVLAVHVVHEMPYPRRMLQECAAALRPGGHLLVAEPRGHVGAAGIRQTREAALQTGLEPVSAPTIWRSISMMLRRP